MDWFLIGGISAVIFLIIVAIVIISVKFQDSLIKRRFKKDERRRELDGNQNSNSEKGDTIRGRRGRGELGGGRRGIFAGRGGEYRSTTANYQESRQTIPTQTNYSTTYPTTPTADRYIPTNQGVSNAYPREPSIETRVKDNLIIPRDSGKHEEHKQKFKLPKSTDRSID